MTHSWKKWIRVRRDLLCPICKRFDWCLVAADGTAAICTRIESDRPAGRNGAGWVHRLDNDRIRLNRWSTPARPPRPVLDWMALSKAFVTAMTSNRLTELSGLLGITTATLVAMNWGWCSNQGCWTVPMRDASGAIIGIRTRFRDGSKRAITGSQTGLFFRPDTGPVECLLVCEGPTDTAAMIDAGFTGVVGRPSCSGGADLIVQLIRLWRPAAVLVVPDRDKPGRDGATNLAARIAQDGIVPAQRINAILPPESIKDCRAWLQKTPEDLARSVGVSVRKLTQNMEVPHRGSE